MEQSEINEVVEMVTGPMEIAKAIVKSDVYDELIDNIATAQYTYLERLITKGFTRDEAMKVLVSADPTKSISSMAK